MSVRVMAAVWESDLPTIEKMVLLAIADSCNDDGTNAWPGISLLARKASVSERRVQQVIAALKARGLLHVALQSGGTRDMRDDRRPNMYSIDLDGVKQISPRLDDGVKNPASRGEKSGSHGVKPISPNPSIEPSLEPSTISAFEEFDLFYRTYPRHQGRKAAQRAYVKARTEVDFQTLIDAAIRFRDDPNRSPEFTPHPATWLNQGRWADDPLPSRGGVSSARVYANAVEAMQWLEIEQ